VEIFKSLENSDTERLGKEISSKVRLSGTDRYNKAVPNVFPHKADPSCVIKQEYTF